MEISTISNWKDKVVFVLGDIMLDRFVYGNVERISPEAPIPVLHFTNQDAMLGGAANVARNIVALGGVAVLAGIVGEDDAGRHIKAELLSNEFINDEIIRSSSNSTIVKTRFVSGAQQIMRLDVESKIAISDIIETEILGSFKKHLHTINSLVLSDYAKGTLSDSLVRKIIYLATENSIPVIVDPKTSDIDRFRGASVIKPNVLEATTITGIKCISDDAAEYIVKDIVNRFAIDAVVLTRGQRGMTVFSKGDHSDPIHIAAQAHEVFDVSGAGDTVVATIALAIGAGTSIDRAAELANVAAGIAVSKRGTSVVFPYEVRRAALSSDGATDHKILDHEDALSVISSWKQQGLKVGFTNGCFDLIHPGHVRLLKNAKASCDRLIVALNTDASVKRLKGKLRPVQKESARATVIASMSAVDLVVFFDDDTPLSIITEMAPDILIKGADYTMDNVVGGEFVKGKGGSVVLVPIEIGQSTTSILSRSAQNK